MQKRDNALCSWLVPMEFDMNVLRWDWVASGPYFVCKVGIRHYVLQATHMNFPTGKTVDTAC